MLATEMDRIWCDFAQSIGTLISFYHVGIGISGISRLEINNKPINATKTFQRVSLCIVSFIPRITVCIRDVIRTRMYLLLSSSGIDDGFAYHEENHSDSIDNPENAKNPSFSS